MSRFAPLRLDLPWRDYCMPRIKAGHDNREVGIDEERKPGERGISTIPLAKASERRRLFVVTGFCEKDIPREC
jgi:hypothetical protein